MDRITDLIDRYFAMWNETDAETATYIDPAVEGERHDGIDNMVNTVQERFPEHRFPRTSEVDCHHDRLRFRWELAPKDGALLVEGTDFGVVAEDGRLQATVGFFDQAPAAQ